MNRAGFITSGIFALAFFAQNNSLAQGADSNPELNEKTNDEEVSVKTVGIKDAREYRVRVSEAYSAKASNGAIIVLYSGSNMELLQKVRQGAADAKAAGAPVRGLVLGKADPDFKNGKDSFVIYADGISVTLRLDASDNPRATVNQGIAEAKEDYFK